MLGEHASISIPQSSKYAEEMRKHEAYPSKYGQPGRPFQHQEYPKMLYRCEFKGGDGIVVVDKHIVNDEQEEANMNSRDFHVLQVAHDRAMKTQTEHAKLAAEREYQIQHGRISERAVAEVRQAEAEAGAVHLPDIQEKRRPGRRKKVVIPA